MIGNFLGLSAMQEKYQFAGYCSSLPAAFRKAQGKILMMLQLSSEAFLAASLR